jgi:hypothetical protein
MERKIHDFNKIKIDEFRNVVLHSSFIIVLGRIDNSYRFIPQSKLVIEQGLTAEMMIVISSLIKELYEKDTELRS